MLDLFETPVVPGLTSCADIISAAEERDLITRIDAETLLPFKFQQWTGKRMTRSFGWNYDFQTGEVARTDPIPDWLYDLRNRVADFSGVAADQLIQALLLRYDVGAGIGWHRDRPIYEHVVGVSLGARAVMRFRKRHGERWLRVTLPLEPRAVYHLSDEARHDWEHSITEMDRTRYSITFRSPSMHGASILKAA